VIHRKLATLLQYKLLRTCIVVILKHLISLYLVISFETPGAYYLANLHFFSKVYNITHLISSVYCKGYVSLSKLQKLEWNNM
jgi:hypothetical protein